MDYKEFAENFKRVACVISVDLKAGNDDNRYIIIDANDAYRRTVVKSLDDL